MPYFLCRALVNRGFLTQHHSSCFQPSFIFSLQCRHEDDRVSTQVSRVCRRLDAARLAPATLHCVAATSTQVPRQWNSNGGLTDSDYVVNKVTSRCQIDACFWRADLHSTEATGSLGTYSAELAGSTMMHTDRVEDFSWKLRADTPRIMWPPMGIIGTMQRRTPCPLRKDDTRYWVRVHCVSLS